MPYENYDWSVNVAQILFEEMPHAQRKEGSPKTLPVSGGQNDRSANRQGSELTHVSALVGCSKPDWPKSSTL
jgi:hypothetical protein